MAGQNRLTSRTVPGGTDTFTYDAAGRLLTATSGAFVTAVARSYDGAGRLITETLTLDGETLPIAATFDDAGRPLQLTAPDGTVVSRDYSPRGDLAHLWRNGALVASRTSDGAGKLVSSTLGNGLIEDRTYAPGQPRVQRIRLHPPGPATVAALLDLVYSYDGLGRKTAELDQVQTDQGQTFAYDPTSRLTAWSRSTLTGAALSQQSWSLSPVGDWSSITRDGVVETRDHTAVHEVTRTGATSLAYDFKGNLVNDGTNWYAWDAENRLIQAIVPGSGTAAPVTATYRYDALGRRVQKTVGGDPTTFVMVGDQVITEIHGPLANIPWLNPGTDSEGAGIDPAVRGSLLAGTATLAALHLDAQPVGSDTPDGWQVTTGDVFQAGSTTYGWSTSWHFGVDRDRIGRPLYDTFIPLVSPVGSPGGLTIAVANGSYPVVIMSGDSMSHQHTNTLRVNGVTVTDPTPYDPLHDYGYEVGDFDGYAIQVTVTDGKIRIEPGPGSLTPTVCFVEVGAKGATVDAALTSRVQAAATAATHATGFAKPAVPAEVKGYAYGPYIDEVLAYTQARPRHAPVTNLVHSGSLYSPEAVTASTGQVVERYNYDSYGRRTVTTSLGVGQFASAIGFRRGFTGYDLDEETGQYYARARNYSSTQGRFVNRDPSGYLDGSSLYRAFFAPNNLDPSGMLAVGTYLYDWTETMEFTGLIFSNKPGGKAWIDVTTCDVKLNPAGVQKTGQISASASKKVGFSATWDTTKFDLGINTDISLDIDWKVVASVPVKTPCMVGNKVGSISTIVVQVYRNHTAKASIAGGFLIGSSNSSSFIISSMLASKSFSTDCACCP